ncbi:MAG TPA: hypothetical protein VEU96_20870 [Bryobacteraceae bacterium]|nr:hypothetical protein [Bryobacteraceae bacterium]
MSGVGYKIRNAITVVIRNQNGYHLRELPAGSVFIASGSQPDVNGMIDGTWQGSAAMAFSRDLTDHATRFEITAQSLRR